MAAISKKDLLIEEAKKFVQRGLLGKAAKAYEQILALEPASISNRQKLAELLVKCGRNDDARKELETIGKYFSKNGFYLKAIAVYKQLQKLFPADISLSMTLAELNEMHGLVANALSEYKLVYEFHEKNGNIPVVLNILEKMQNIDPQNIPITIKLAESYAQHKKMDEAYTSFIKAAFLLSERGDNTTLSVISDRIQKLFPDKPDFILEVLSEQILHGNAAIAIGSIQKLLRSNPDNKRVWDLTVLAYQQLKQPQRVKLAYQHYLKFFPTDPAAMLGLISCTTAEQNLAGALELLRKYEASLISSGFLEQLKQIYISLDKIDPINISVLEGLIRIANACGDKNEQKSLASKLQSLLLVSERVKNGPIEPKSPHAFFNECPVGSGEAKGSPFSPSPFAEQTTAPETVLSYAAIDPAQQTDEEIEIEIDIDIEIDSPFSPSNQKNGTILSNDNWLDSVGDLFDAIDTAPSAVKFGSNMETSDAQSHFDLGQAFKEMGLYDEAINEFRQASQDTLRRVECLIMQCTCLRERGEADKAITMLLALLKPGLSAKESCAVKYELASAYGTIGNPEESNKLLSEINAANPSFRDINSCIDTSNHPDLLDFSDEDLQDF